MNISNDTRSVMRLSVYVTSSIIITGINIYSFTFVTL